jgi:hypothetical protein
MMFAGAVLAYPAFGIAAPLIDGTQDIQSSMRMADVDPRFQVIDGLLGSLQGDNKSGLGLSSKKDLLNAGVYYNPQGLEANDLDTIGLNASTHTASGFSAEANYFRSVEELRSLLSEDHYEAGRLRLAQDSRYGEFFLAGDISRAGLGEFKKVTHSPMEQRVQTQRAVIGHRYTFDGFGSLANSFGYTHRDIDAETQEYKTWNTTYSAQFGASKISASITKGLSGVRDFSSVPLLGAFNPNFYAAQLGYGLDGLALNDLLGYGVSGSYFNGSEDMPSSERMTIGGRGRGSSHEAGVVSGYKGSFAEARLYGMNVPGFSYLSMKPYVSVNGGRTIHPVGGEYALVSAEVGVIGRWRDFSSTLSYAKSVRDENIDHDSRLNVELSYTY